MKMLMFLAALAVAAPAFAQAEEEPALCTDRPSKANAVCTVPAGKLQLETDLVSWTRLEAGGARTDTILYTNPTLKLGLGANTDLQVNIAPLVEIRNKAGGLTNSQTGVSDLIIRVKQRLTEADGKVQVGLIPFVKAPAAKRGIGNREWEGGLAVPISFSLPSSFTLTLGPEFDVLHDGDGSGKHVQLIGVVNLARPVTPQLTLMGELWTAQNYDPAGTTRQYSADVAAAYLVSPRLQADLGANFGLNQATPGFQLYVGLSTRF